MTTAAEATAVATKQFGLMQALEEGGPISWAIFLTMVVMSAVSWYIMFTKLIEQGKVIKQGSEGARKFWTSTSVKDGLNKFEKDTAYRQLVDDALLADEQHGKLIDAQDQHEWLQSSMQRSQAAINSKLSSGLAFLATVGSTSPFVGLLGTVIGIYNALIKIGATAPSGCCVGVRSIPRFTKNRSWVLPTLIGLSGLSVITCVTWSACGFEPNELAADCSAR